MGVNKYGSPTAYECGKCRVHLEVRLSFGYLILSCNACEATYVITGKNTRTLGTIQLPPTWDGSTPPIVKDTL